MAKPDIKKKKRRLIIAGLLLVHLIFLLNLKFTAWPEMQLWPYLILNGWLPYRDIAIAHNPLLLIDLSIFNFIFGTGLMQLKVYTWLTILFLDALLYWITKKIWNKKVALYALAFFIPFQLYYEGNGLWFDLSLAFVSLVAYFYLSKRDFFKAGIFWVLAFFVKQTAVWFLIPIAIFVLQDKPYKDLVKKVSNFTKGVLVITVPLILLIWILGIFPDYLFWAYEFGVGILPSASGQVSFPGITLALKALIPFTLLLFLPGYFKNRKRTNLLGWVVAGFMGTFPRWELFHFQPALPFLAISAGLIFSQMRKYSYGLKILLMIVLLINSALIGSFLIRQWRGGTRFYEPYILAVSSYIAGEVDEDEQIFVANTWDSLYSMTETLPAVKPWVPQLSWYMNLPGIQQQFVQDLAENKPEIVVLLPYTETGLSSYQPPLVVDFIKDNYMIIDEVGDHLIYKPKK